jgi:hypothetical protein
MIFRCSAIQNIFFKKKNELTVDKIELLTSLDWLERPPMVEEIETIEDEDNIEPQIWKDFEDTTERFRKSLYYGRIPSSDRFSLPVTELCVANFNHLGLEGLEKKLDRLSIDRAAEITRETCSSPTSLVLALLYLDRLRSSNPKYLSNISSTDLFLVSLMVASKFLHDDGEEDEVFNDEWAKSGAMEKKELNELELNFLSAIDWSIYVSSDEYEQTTQNIELAVALKQVGERGGWTTYSDLLVLSRTLELIKIWEILYEYTIKVTAVCIFAYAASLMTMMGTCNLLNSSTSRSGSTSLNASTTVPKSTTDWNLPNQETTLANDDSEENVGHIEQILSGHERLTDDLDFGKNSSFFEPEPLVPKSCPHQTSIHNELLKEHEMISRLTNSLFALKIGTFRDLMVGSQMISGLGVGHG